MLPHGRYVRWALAFVFLVYTALLAYQARTVGMTIDEPSHLAAGYLYWLGQDILKPADTPPLTRITSGWVAVALKTKDPHLTKWWDTRDAYLIGGELLGPGGHRPRRLLFYTRLTFLVYPLLTLYLIWLWGRALFGEAIAFCLVLLFALEPTILGHGYLVKSDVAAAFGAVWFAYAAWRHWNAPSIRTLLLLSAALSVAVLAKYTLLILIPIGYAIALWRPPRLLGAVLLPVILYTAILLSGQLHAQPVSQADLATVSGWGLSKGTMFMVKILALLPWPTQFVNGILYIAGALRAEGFTGYLLGHKITGWTPSYFPIAWAIKFPIPLQILTLSSLVVFAFRRTLTSADVLIWGLALLFFGSAVSSNYHIGFRHLIPCIPFLILGSGYALRAGSRSFTGRIVAASLMLWLCFSTLRIYPYTLAYFNEWIGGPEAGWKYLADSNIDWGQDLPALGRYLQSHPQERVRTFLFNPDHVALYFSQERVEPQPWPGNIPPGFQYTPRPGVYAIGVNLLTGAFYPPGYEDYLRRFRELTPIARAGYSILIYRVE